jgi:hypothetical protein
MERILIHKHIYLYIFMNYALNAPNNNELYGKNVNIKRKKKMRHLFGTPFLKRVHIYKTKFAGLTAKNCFWHTSFMFHSQKLFFFFFFVGLTPFFRTSMSCFCLF